MPVIRLFIFVSLLIAAWAIVFFVFKNHGAIWGVISLTCMFLVGRWLSNVVLSRLKHRKSGEYKSETELGEGINRR